MSQGEDQGPLSPSLHHSDSIPNIFNQINEYARLESLTKKTSSTPGSAQKSLEGSTIRNSVISNLQHALNLSNISSRSECILGTASVADSNCWHKPQLRLMDRDHENNQIMSDVGGLSLPMMSDDCEVPAKKPKLSPNGADDADAGHFCFLYQNDRLRDMKSRQESHREHLTELFFLQNGGNLMDYFSWKRRPNNLLACYLFSEKLDNDDISADERIQGRGPRGNPAMPHPIQRFAYDVVPLSIRFQEAVNQRNGNRKMEISRIDSCPVSSPNVFQPSSQKLSDHMSSSFSGLAGFNVASPCSENTLLSYSQGTPDMVLLSTSTPTSTRPKMVKDWTPLSTGAGTNFLNSTPTTSLASLSSELSSSAVAAAASAAYETSQESIAELAKQEAQVMEKIMELRKKGLWSVRRIAKAAEPTHAKAHWDYVMEEMQWLAADFGQERKAKKAGSRKIARMVVRHFQEQQQKEVKAEKEDALKLKRIASNLAKAVKEFWTNIEKVVQYKQQSRLEEKRRKALDMHLSFIVDQTEKYSTWLTEGLGASLAAGGQSSQPASANSVASSESNVDEDFKPNQDSDDDEETIEKEEQDLDVDKTAEEVAALQKEGEMSFEDFLQTLPKEVLNSATGAKVDQPAKGIDKRADDVARSDAESYAPSEDSTDDEETLEEEEKQEKVNHSEELLDLQKEGEMPIEELLKMYQSMHDEKLVDDDLNDEDADKNANAGEDVKIENKEEEDEETNDNDKDSEVGTEFLIKKEGVAVKEEEVEDKNGPGKEINDIAATAMSIQPTGYTLETAHVKTSVPFLLKHSLREYQHVGLDWLATMYEQRLNGILADEMGLGKTIQTIALLGFLACEKGIWGPHLIVVPTSVMLNWEMEIKKWCPAFKILTYYGSLKERKAKRQGWTKTNAFHVCITSYKLVIQDHQAFRRKKWKYFILDEAQNIKNFKSQRWQTLLNFHSQRRLLLTGTPLQNNLMELWSLMHFLMPHVFASHREFKEWFSNPLTGMIEGSMEYNESLVKRLHKVLRPFLLRRLKQDVEKQMPKKYEHVVMCRLSKRQRFLYDDFMAQAKTKETLATGHFMSVINILMQLRKVCNHPNLFDPRPIVSPFHMHGLTLHFPSLAARALERNPFVSLDFTDIHPNFCDLEISLSSVTAKRVGELRTKRPLIVEIDSIPDPPPRLEPLPDGTQLIVTFPSESENPSSAVPSADGCTSFGPENPIGGTDVRSKMEGEQPAAEKDIVVADKEKRSPLYLESLELKRRTARKAKLEVIHHYNQRRCSFTPVYGRNLLDAVDCMKPQDHRSVSDVGYVQCLNAHSRHENQGLNQVWENTRHLAEIILTPQQYLSKLEDILHRFVFVIPPATAPRSVMHLSHPAPSARNQQMMEEFVLQKEFSPRMNYLHNIIKNQRVQFPELRLIQYDCGKLQTMDILLRRLKTGGHRALVFTQMTRMLDVLEAFLNFHGHRYLRLDGTTKVEQRQALMERFNMDPRIFCFILSTRSGGIGVNLTGADTVIFYDSDWNPTMDAQAQDRCHRIGQTRDVHIYRLISEKTVEENILKKANEKRLLGNVAIEGGNFTTAFFKQQTIKDLFEEPSGLESLVTEDNRNVPEETPAGAENGGLNEELIEQALCAAEDETDIQAVKVARAEQKAELAEFDETQPWDEVKTDQDAKRDTDDPSSNVEVELALLEKDLTPVERYAVSFMEMQLAPITNEELMKAEEEVGLAKEEWELSHLKALKEEEERRAELEEDEMLYTSLHYTAWKQQPKLKELDKSFGEVPVRRKYKGVGRPSNEMRLERRNLNGMKRSVSPTDSWEDSNDLSTTFDDSRISSSSLSTNSSLIHANHVNSAAKLKKMKTPKRPKVVTSLVIKVVKKNSSVKSSQSSPGDAPRPVKEPKKRFGKPPKRSLDDDSGSALPKKKRKKKALVNTTDSLQFTNDAAVTSAVVSTATLASSHAVTVATAVSMPPRPRPMSVTKLLDSKRYLTSHGQRIIVQRVSGDITATVSAPTPPKPTPPPVPAARDPYESKPIPILEKLGAAVLTCSTAATASLNNPCRPLNVVGKTPIAAASSTTTVFPSHLHVSRLNQIVSSISQNTIQNVTLAQSSPGTIQYFLRPGGVVSSGGIRTENLVIANSGVQQTIAHPGQGTSFVLVPQGLGKSSRFIMPAVTNQANKQSVLILPNAGKQNYIVAQQSGNRPGYILIPNNAGQQNFILTASSGGVLPAAQMSTQSVGMSAPSPKIINSFPLLQTQQMQVSRQLLSPGLTVGSQQSIPVVQAGISNTVPILEKLAMQLSGANVIGMPQQQQQQYRTRILPSTTIVQPSPKQHELLRYGQPVSNIISARPTSSTMMGQLPSGLSVTRQIAGPAPSGKMGGMVAKQVSRQSPVSLLSGGNALSQSAAGSLVSRLPAGQSSGIVLTGKPMQPVNVAQFIVNQPRSHISVDKLTQLAVNGQLVFVDGRHGQELAARGSTGPANTNTPKK